MIGDLRQLLRDEGTTAMLVTHDHSEAQLLADQVLVLFDGVQGQLDSTRALFNFPANPEVAAFLGYSIVDPKRLPELLRIVVPRISAIHPAAVRLTDDTEGSYSAQVIAVQGSHGDGRLLLAKFHLPRAIRRANAYRFCSSVQVCPQKPWVGQT